MSRLIKKHIIIPAGITVTQSEGVISVKGPKGELHVNLFDGVALKLEDGKAWIEKTSEETYARAMSGTIWALLTNAIAGVSEGFVKILEIEGVGYRAAMEGKDLVLHLGYALPVRMKIIEGATVTVEKNVIKIAGIDKELVGQVAAKIRALKKPEPYKGKGIHYLGEVIRRKAGKKAGAA